MRHRNEAELLEQAFDDASLREHKGVLLTLTAGGVLAAIPGAMDILKSFEVSLRNKHEQELFKEVRITASNQEKGVLLTFSERTTYSYIFTPKSHSVSYSVIESDTVITSKIQNKHTGKNDYGNIIIKKFMLNISLFH